MDANAQLSQRAADAEKASGARDSAGTRARQLEADNARLLRELDELHQVLDQQEVESGRLQELLRRAHDESEQLLQSPGFDCLLVQHLVQLVQLA